MVHSHSKIWVRLLGLGLALGLMCTLLPAYAFAEEPSAEGSAAAQSAETEQAAPETDPAQAAPEQAQPEAETAQTAPETAQPQPAAEMPSDETAVEPAATDYSGSAAIYYLADPAGDPLTNDTGEWAPAANSSTILAQINTTGASWDHNNGKNITINVASYITAWPDGSKGDTWTVKRDDPATGANFTYILDSIWDSYKSAVEKATGVTGLTKADVTQITLTPRKISRDNGGRSDYHIDCALSVTCKKTFIAKFWVKEPGGEYKQVDAKNYKTGDSVQYTANVAETYTDANGKLYNLDGWYVEDGTGSAPGDKTAFPHTPTDAQLTDGVVNYYAHYVPVTTSVTVTKQVTGPMGDRNKKFTFQWSCGDQSGNFTLSNGQSATIENVGVGEQLTLTESDNSGYAVSVSYGGQNYNVTTAADAQSSSVQLAVAEGGGTITVTNSKDVNPDTGITLDSAPYAVALGLTAVAAAALLYRRNRRRG